MCFSDFPGYIGEIPKVQSVMTQFSHHIPIIFGAERSVGNRARSR